jgi:hypothetical protein
MILMQWTNPFAEFLNNAHSEIHKIQSEPEVRSGTNLLPRFVEISEDRSFVFDIVNRVEMLATAFDRLRELYRSYVFDDERWELIEAQRISDPVRVSFDDSDELRKGMDRCHGEAQVLVTFAYYEISTLLGLLSDSLSPLPQSDLEYLVGVRNKILTHPRRNARVKNSRSVLTLGPILIAHLVGAEIWCPLLRDWYLKELIARGVNLDDEAGAEANVALIRDPSKRTKKLAEEEMLQLKSYVIPEPNLLQSACEMASLLETKFLPTITSACAKGQVVGCVLAAGRFAVSSCIRVNSSGLSRTSGGRRNQRKGHSYSGWSAVTSEHGCQRTAVAGCRHASKKGTDRSVRVRQLPR